MTTELILLLTVFVFVIAGVVKTPTKSFEEAGPRLGMRLEKQIETGTEFTFKSLNHANPVEWREQ